MSAIPAGVMALKAAMAGSGAAAGGSGLGSAILGGSAISSGSSLLGGLLNRPSTGTKLISTFSKDQKQLNKLIMDWLLGRSYNSAGKEVGRNPLLQRSIAKGIPQRVLAPMTKNQTAGLDFAKQLMGKLQNPKRPDYDYLSGLARGVLPTSPRAAALGAVLVEGESAAVGEDGVELVKNIGGNLVVIPNPDSVRTKKDRTRARRKSKAAMKKHGADFGFQAGTFDTRKRFEYDGRVHYLPTTPGYLGDRLGDTSQSYRADLQSGFKTYAQENFGNQPWYQNFQSQYGGDIGNVWKPLWDTGRLGKIPGGGGPASRRGIATEYTKAYDEFYGGLESVNTNPDVDRILGGLPEGTGEGFADYLKGPEGVKFGELAGNYALQGGQYGFTDPYSVDVGNLERAQSDYLTSQGYELGDDGWAKVPAPGEPDPFDWSGALGDLEPEDMDGLTEFLQTYEGGVFKGDGFRFNPETGEQEFNADPEHVEGIKKAAADYQVKKADDAAKALEDDLVDLPDDGDLPVDDDTIMDHLYGAISQYTTSFDSEAATTAFDESVLQPAMDAFNREQVPAINQAFAGGALFTGARESAVQAAMQDMNRTLASERSTFMYNAEQDHKNRGLAAIGVGMDLALLPAVKAGQMADNDYKLAATAALWAGTEMQTALVDMQITNESLYGLMALWQIFGDEYKHNQLDWDNEMTNILNGSVDGVLPWDQILAVMLGITNRSELALVTE